MKQNLRLGPRAVARTALLALLGLMAIGSQQCGCPPQAKSAKFKAFSASPAMLCTNFGLPIVEIAWTVDGSTTRHCVTIEANGVTLLSDSQGPALGVAGGRCGENEWSRSVRFNLAEHFGANIPPTITFTGRLDEASVGGRRDVDSATATVQTRSDCTPGGVTP